MNLAVVRAHQSYGETCRETQRNAEKRRETPRTQASESASRDAKMVTMENQVRSFTFGHTRAAAVRSQRRIPAPHAEIP